MRELSSFPNKRHAERLAGFLATQSIQTRLDDDDGDWVLWIVNDDDRSVAETALEEFRGNPDDSKYVEAAGKARELSRRTERKKKQIKRREIDLTKRWSGSWWYAHRATYILIGISVVVAILCTDFRRREVAGWGLPALCNDEDSAVLEKLRIVGFDRLDSELQSILKSRFAERGLRASELDAAGIVTALLNDRSQLGRELLRGQVWRPVTPIFLHFGVLHLLFNMMWLRSLGSSVEFVRGTGRFLALVTVIAVISNVAQFYSSGPSFGGMSGVVFGLIGYVWMKGRTQPHLGLGLDQQTVVYAFLWLFLCMTGSFGPIANAAHLGGLIVGMAIGARQNIWKRLRGYISA